MGEERKSSFLGDVFGEWTVIAKVEPRGDRVRRWMVQNEEGVQMESTQTDLKSLALAKKLKDKAAEKDATKPLSAQIAASVIAANAEFKANENPFADMTPEVVQTEDVIVESENPFGLSFEEVVGDIEIEGADEFVEAWVKVANGVAAEPTDELRDATGPDVTVEFNGLTIEPDLPNGLVIVGEGVKPEPVVVTATPALIAAMDFVTKAKVQLNYALKALENLL